MDVAHRFFANLLPERSVRQRIVRSLKIANADFDLPRAIGWECAGALSLLQVEHSPPTEYIYHLVSDEALADLITRRGQVYTWFNMERPRRSLAGAQDKCPILLENDTFWPPKKETPSSHI